MKLGQLIECNMRNLFLENIDFFLLTFHAFIHKILLFYKNYSEKDILSMTLLSVITLHSVITAHLSHQKIKPTFN